MPYIAPKNREALDPLIDELAQRIVAETQQQSSEVAFAGLLNYSSTRLALAVIKLRFGRIQYGTIATIMGVFTNIADEFYRRLAVPYEDKKMAESGDVDLYQEFLATIQAPSEKTHTTRQ